MAQTATSGSTGNVTTKMVQEPLLFKPAQLISKEVYVDVGKCPVRIMGNILEGHSIEFTHVYKGQGADCNDIPELPVYSDDGCNLLKMSNEADAACSNGRRMRNEVWLYDEGRYRLQYVHATSAQTAIPADVYVWKNEMCNKCCGSVQHNGYRT